MPKMERMRLLLLFSRDVRATSISIIAPIRCVLLENRAEPVANGSTSLVIMYIIMQICFHWYPIMLTKASFYLIQVVVKSKLLDGPLFHSIIRSFLPPSMSPFLTSSSTFEARRRASTYIINLVRCVSFKTSDGKTGGDMLAIASWHDFDILLNCESVVELARRL